MSDLQHQRIVELCQELRLSAMPNLYSGIAQSAAAKEASFADFLEETLRAERDARSARTREMFARVAGFPTIKTLDGFDFGFATGVVGGRGKVVEYDGGGAPERDECQERRSSNNDARDPCTPAACNSRGIRNRTHEWISIYPRPKSSHFSEVKSSGALGS